MAKQHDRQVAEGEPLTPSEMARRIDRLERTLAGARTSVSATRRRFLQGLAAVGVGDVRAGSGPEVKRGTAAALEQIAPGVYNWATPGGYSGPESGRSGVSPESGLIYKARDSGGVYHADGSGWELLPGMFSGLRIPTTYADTQEMEANHPRDPSVPLEFIGVESSTGERSGAERGPTVVLRSLDDQRATRLLLHDGSGSDTERSAFIGRYNADRDTTSEVLKVEPNSVELEAEVPGDQLNLQEGDTATPTEALMTFQTSDSDGRKTTRLDISGGEDLAHVRTRMLDEVRFNAIDLSGDGVRDVSAKARFVSFTGHNHSIRNDDGRLRFEDEARGDYVDLAGNGKLDLRHSNGLRGPPEYSNAAADDLQNHEVAFDIDRGGTGTTALLYKDSSGTVHYWDADGTL
jgi:hypothetical protein